jgi:D-alanyl-D-alanine carboxypeptidase
MPPALRLQSALEAQVAAGAPGALARIQASHVGLRWDGAAGHLARGTSRALRSDDAFRAASVTKSVTAVVAVRLAHDGDLALDEPLGDQLDPKVVCRWSALDALPRTTPWQLLAHTSGVPNYFNDEAFLARLRRTRATSGVRSSWWITRPRTAGHTSRPARASRTPTPAT